MDFDKPVWLLLGVPILALVAYALWGETDKARFDRLEIGMSAAEVRDVIYPVRGGKYGHMRPDVRDNEILHLNDCMILTISDGLLVHKEWVGKDEADAATSGRK